MVLKREARSSSSRAEVQIEAQLQQMVKDQGRFDAKWGAKGHGGNDSGGMSTHRQDVGARTE